MTTIDKFRPVIVTPILLQSCSPKRWIAEQKPTRQCLEATIRPKSSQLSSFTVKITVYTVYIYIQCNLCIYIFICSLTWLPVMGVSIVMGVPLNNPFQLNGPFLWESSEITHNGAIWDMYSWYIYIYGLYMFIPIIYQLWLLYFQKIQQCW